MACRESAGSWASWWSRWGPRREAPRDGTDPLLRARDLAAAAGALQIPPLVQHLCGAGHRPLRHTPRLGARRLAAAAVQPLQPRRLRPAGGTDPVPPTPPGHPPLAMVFASNIFQPLIDFFESILRFFHDTVGFGWGMSIIALTLLVRAALLPLTLKQFKSMQSLAAHQPELKRLQEKYKGDKERLNQEMMKFYKENKINPLASCLPMVAQLPVFISLFYMLRKDLLSDICPVHYAAFPNEPCGSTPASEFFFIPDLTDNATGSVL